MTIGFGFALAVSALAGAAHAQRDPAYEAARASGQVGEQLDGYLGVVGAQSGDIRKLVSALNIKRRDAYTKNVPQGSSIEDFAFITGCNLIAKTTVGEKYQAPDGQWQTRGSAAPQRHSRCP
ncbi:hypothetical protein FHS49_003037 [Sphingobium boeckii]|uniref:DUF1318 domain-containing protein n=2 Tax=Sphingobium boeckii TaxID=1082345 RepID=A0A7W9AKB8_9SPHN|nr:hypothetical protein [Sphingobium boeckii]